MIPNCYDVRNFFMVCESTLAITGLQSFELQYSNYERNSKQRMKQKHSSSIEEHDLADEEAL